MGVARLALAEAADPTRPRPQEIPLGTCIELLIVGGLRHHLREWVWRETLRRSERPSLVDVGSQSRLAYLLN